MGAEARGMVARLALEADDAAENDSADEPRKDHRILNSGWREHVCEDEIHGGLLSL